MAQKTFFILLVLLFSKNYAMKVNDIINQGYCIRQNPCSDLCQRKTSFSIKEEFGIDTFKVRKSLIKTHYKTSARYRTRCQKERTYIDKIYREVLVPWVQFNNRSIEEILGQEYAMFTYKEPLLKKDVLIALNAIEQANKQGKINGTKKIFCTIKNSYKKSNLGYFYIVRKLVEDFIKIFDSNDIYSNTMTKMFELIANKLETRLIKLSIEGGVIAFIPKLSNTEIFIEFVKPQKNEFGMNIHYLNTEKGLDVFKSKFIKPWFYKQEEPL